VDSGFVSGLSITLAGSQKYNPGMELCRFFFLGQEKKKYAKWEWGRAEGKGVPCGEGDLVEK